jgi:phosphate transport system substrate-binding protein
MNNRLAALSTFACTILLLASCGRVAEVTQPPPPETPVAVTAPPEGLAEETAGLWGRIDGSTATIPLTAALHGLFGGSGAPPVHYTTSQAYFRLLYDEVDLIFVTYPSEDELADARDEGIELDIIPVVKDALVFLVNAENPVDGISLEQARDIYTGEITNWKVLGGLDADIVPYQARRIPAARHCWQNF